MENFHIKKEDYPNYCKQKQPKPPLAKNVISAFLVGGAISLIGQLIQNVYIALGVPPLEASNPTVATVIFIASLLTGLGVFDIIGRVGGAGTAIPVTGFANSITSAAIEFKKEGFVLGVGAKMFSLAGSVIVFGVVTAFVIGIISAII